MLVAATLALLRTEDRLEDRELAPPAALDDSEEAAEDAPEVIEAATEEADEPDATDWEIELADEASELLPELAAFPHWDC